MANAGAGIFQGMPVSTSLSASSLNESSGARTPIASLITGGLVILTLLFLAPLFSNLPKAVLGAVIIDAVVFGMIDVPELRRLRRVTPLRLLDRRRGDRRGALVGVLAGVVIGVALSLGWLIHVATAPPMALLGRERGTQVFRDLDENPGDETFPGVAVLRLDSGLFFATAQALEDRVRELADDGAAPLARSCSTSRGSTSSTRRARAARRDPRARGKPRSDAAARAREAPRARRAARGRLRRAARQRSHPRERPSRGRGGAQGLTPCG